jgi:hypothetical protein
MKVGAADDRAWHDLDRKGVKPDPDAGVSPKISWVKEAGLQL